MFTIEGVIKNIVNEISANGSSTGRYLVDLIVPNFFGVDVFPFVMLDKWTNIIDDEEIEVTKEMFYDGSDNSFCKIGDTVKLSGDIESHSFGAVVTESTSKRTFGGGAKNVRQGYSRIEWTIKAGDIVEDADKYDNDIIKIALDERDIQLDNNYKKRLEDYRNATANKSNNSSAPKASPKNASSNASPFGKPSNTNPFGGSATKKQNPFG